MLVEGLSRNERRALEELEKQSMLFFDTLPSGVSSGTMKKLEMAGLIERVYNGVGRYSKYVGWRKRTEKP